MFEDIDDNYWMSDRLYQNIKAEFLPQKISEIRKMMSERYKCLRMAQKSGISDEWKKVQRNKKQGEQSS